MGANVRALFALFAVSGFTGLVYESVWSHYLKLFLGSAAFAQSFVLAAFMGGMALGAWLASRASARWGNLLAAYGWIEALIGLAALVFHPLFVGLTEGSLERVIPAIGTPAAIEAYKYALCALLIVPQTVLLGMTFPLMSGAVIRRHPRDAQGTPAGGHRLATLYFANSIGGAAGALAAAFWLIGWLGMPGALAFAGALNLALALAVLSLARGGEPRPAPAAPAAGAATLSRGMAVLLLAAAGVTGAASFVYEITWIRMLSLVLSSSFHAFELMLSAFIAGLALGGLWIRKRIDRIANPIRFSGWIQILMGLAALATVFVYQETFDWMHWALTVLQRNASSYPLFNLFSHGIAFAVMLPATFLAGMTLPLFTHALMRGGRGERAIGQVYAANTLGAIAGVLLAVHLLVPEAGLKVALVVGAALDVVLGAWLLRWSGVRLQRQEAFASLILGLAAAVVTARATALEPARLASGVFRHGLPELERAQIVYYRDGKTASVSVYAGADGNRTISTNGKPDAAIQMDPTRPRNEDEFTMTLLAALPLLARPEAKTFANIGLGSGLTAETLLSHAGLERLDIVEIEPAIASGAYAFYPRVDRLFRDRRAGVYFEDAKSFFARHGRRYDVIVSEPSNPWVNGVASLFTAEFYRQAARHLAAGGLFVQWLHIYELGDRQLASMFGALDAVFPDYDVYQTSSGDLVVVAARDGPVALPGELPAAQRGLLEMLWQVDITKREHVLARRLGSRRELAPLLAQFAAPVNSDFRPLVQLEAPRARFLRQSADAIVQLAIAPLPVLEMLGEGGHAYLQAPGPRAGSGRYLQQVAALQLHRALVSPRAAPAGDEAPPAPALLLREPGVLCAARPAGFVLEQLHIVAINTLAHLAPAPRRELWVDAAWIGCPLARAAPAVRERFGIYRAVAERDAPAMLERARALLEGPPLEDREWARFVLLTAVLGAQAGGRGEEARRLWAAHAPALVGSNASPVERYVAEWHR
jgi:predicted membrane-bound spermidine synthase